MNPGNVANRGASRAANAALTIPVKSIAALGIVLIALGVTALAYQGITYTSREAIVDVGPLHATAEREKIMPLAPVLGIATLAGGIVLVFAGVPRHA
jgi:hypothetical protein